MCLLTHSYYMKQNKQRSDNLIRIPYEIIDTYKSLNLPFDFKTWVRTTLVLELQKISFDIRTKQINGGKSTMESVKRQQEDISFMINEMKSLSEEFKDLTDEEVIEKVIQDEIAKHKSK